MATNNAENNIPWRLIQSQTVSGSPSTIAFTSGITSSYATYVVVLSGVTPSANDQLAMQVSTDGGATYIAIGYQSGTLGTPYNSNTTAGPNSTATVLIGGTIKGVSGGGMNGSIFCLNFNNGYRQSFVGSLGWFASTPLANIGTLGCRGPGTTTVNALRFSWISTATFLSGNISLYGLVG